MGGVLRKSEKILAEGGSALDAVSDAVAEMEDLGLFNAGKGGLPNKSGFVELDAGLMDGRDRSAGAVASVHTVKNPIQVARKVMEATEHVLLVGKGAEHFAENAGFPTVPDSYYVPSPDPFNEGHGTVGAVAMDRCGNLAAATSTGGWPGKLPGRVGDSPIPGAGFYASNETCAVSSTGKGEYFLRWNAASDIGAMMEYQHKSIEEAANSVLKKLKSAGGGGGFIAVDRTGQIAFPYTTPTMGRGYVREDGQIHVGMGSEMVVWKVEAR